MDSLIKEKEIIIKGKIHYLDTLKSDISTLKLEKNHIQKELDASKKVITKLSNTIVNQDFYYIESNDGYQFEKYIANLLSYLNYKNIKRTQDSNDQGIDVTAEQNGEKVGFQCKLYTSPVGNAAVQQAIAGREFLGLDKAIVVTTNYFTGSARSLAEKTNIELIDRDGLYAIILSATKDSSYLPFNS